jgi:nitrate/nitrite transport system ATP-binding protein
MATATPFLELRGVGKGYGSTSTRTEVLRDINLSVAKGEFVAVVGYSGAGKTTLINLVAGLAQPDTGTVTLDGKPITGPGADRGVVFQNYSLLPWLSAHDNVLLAVDETFAGWTAEKKHAHADQHLALVNLAAARDKKPAELSGGMRQRVALARALAMDPQVLLMDEPLGALDALTRATLQDEISRIFLQGTLGGSPNPPATDSAGRSPTSSTRQASRKTVLLITNDVDEGILLADRIIPLSMGPSATLGPAIDVTIPRPRDRKAMNHDPQFKAVRNQVIEYLLGPGRRRITPRESSTSPSSASSSERTVAA